MIYQKIQKKIAHFQGFTSIQKDRKKSRMKIYREMQYFFEHKWSPCHFSDWSETLSVGYSISSQALTYVFQMPEDSRWISLNSWVRTRASLWFEKDKQNIDNYRRLIEKFSLFLNRSEAVVRTQAWIFKNPGHSLNFEKPRAPFI